MLDLDTPNDTLLGLVTDSSCPVRLGSSSAVDSHRNESQSSELDGNTEAFGSIEATLNQAVMLLMRCAGLSARSNTGQLLNGKKVKLVQ